MGSKLDKLHIYFFPHMAPGHMIPLVDMARQFAGHGLKATIVMTALNASLFSKTIERDRQLGLHISIRQVRFPSCGTGLPEGCENLASTTTPEMSMNFYKALDMLQKPLEQIIEEDQPDCLVADFFYPWATEIACKFGIPRLVFHGIGVIPLCVYHSLNRHEPYKNIESNSETFIVSDLPDTIKMTRLQLPDHSREITENDFTNMIKRARNSEQTSYGVIVNSFNELEPAYSEIYKKVIGRRAWLIGPVSLCNKDNEDKAQRGNKVSIDENECLNWLNSKKTNSVLYICFGSMSNFSAAQLHEIATGLEASGQQFIWVVRKEKENDEEQERWLPEG